MQLRFCLSIVLSLVLHVEFRVFREQHEGLFSRIVTTKPNRSSHMTKAMNMLYEIGDTLYVNLTNRCPCSCTFCIRNESDTVNGRDVLWLEREPAAGGDRRATPSTRPRVTPSSSSAGTVSPWKRSDVLRRSLVG